MHGGQYGMNLIPRHNTEMNYAGFHDQFSQLLLNRIFYVVLHLACPGAAMILETLKEMGKWEDISHPEKSTSGIICHSRRSLVSCFLRLRLSLRESAI